MKSKITVFAAAALLAVFLGSSIAEARVGSTVERRQRPGKGWHHYYGHSAPKNYTHSPQSWNRQPQSGFSRPAIVRHNAPQHMAPSVAGGRVISERVISVEPAMHVQQPAVGQAHSPDRR